MPKEKRKRGRRAEEARRKQEERDVKHVDIDMPMEFYDAPDQGSSKDNAARGWKLLITSDF